MYVWVYTVQRINIIKICKKCYQVGSCKAESSGANSLRAKASSRHSCHPGLLNNILSFPNEVVFQANRKTKLIYNKPGSTLTTQLNVKQTWQPVGILNLTPSLVNQIDIKVPWRHLDETNWHITDLTSI